MKNYFRVFAAFVIFFLAASVAIAQTVGVKVDDNTADAQNYYNSAPNQIFVDPETKKVYLGYTWSDDPEWQTFTARINNVTDNIKTDLPTKADYGYGLPDIRKGKDGRLLVGAVSGAQGWFYWSNWANGVTMFKETGVGTAQFDSTAWFDENPAGGAASNLACWLQVDDNGVIHWLAYDGWGYIFLYKRSTDGGKTFSPAVIIGGAYAASTSIDIQFLGGDYPFGAALASDGKGKVAIAVLDQGGDVYLVESTDQGETWPETATNITNFGDGLIDGFGGYETPRPDRFIDALYDKHGNLHLVWEASYFLDDTQKDQRHPWPNAGADAPYLADFKPVLQHWSPQTGVTTAAVSKAPQKDLDAAYRLMSGRSRGCLVSSPTLAYDAEKDILYVGYVQYDEEHGKFTDPANDPYGESVARFVAYGDLYVAASLDHGTSWTTPVNITNTPTFDERCFVLNEQVVDGKLHAMFMADEQPGFEFFGYLPSVVSSVYYYAFEADKIVSKVSDQQATPIKDFELYPAYPNPFNSAGTLRFFAAQTAHVELAVYDINGNKIKTLLNQQVPQGAHSIRWDGTTDRGESVSSGIYLFRLKTESGTLTQKLTLLK
ncbi:MAG: T9SS type A sorting domain-containing protein [candidate division KSB1 bacterium]|nr:T9SS type A sorting domain-containing protein [candidate division KSB1 bacterium]